MRALAGTPYISCVTVTCVSVPSGIGLAQGMHLHRAVWKCLNRQLQMVLVGEFSFDESNCGDSVPVDITSTFSRATVMLEGFERLAGNRYAFRLHIKCSTALFPII